MKIGLVLDDTLDSPDGVQQYVRVLGEWLHSRGHEVSYLVGETSQMNIPGLFSLSRNIKIAFNGNRLTIPLPVSRTRLKQVLRELDFDILHIQAPYSPFFAGRLIGLASPTTAVVGSFHILPYGRLAQVGSSLLGKINSRTSKSFDVMMATSAVARDFAVRYYGFDSIVVPNPFRFDEFSEARSRRIHQRNTGRELRIVFLGRLVPRKGARTLLAAVKYLDNLTETGTKYHVVIAGKGPELGKLKKFVSLNNLSEKVSFPGFVPEQDKARLLASADILVFPSTAGESFGISLLEGMAASPGVVLAGDNPGYTSVVADKRQLVAPTETKTFAATLAYWLEHERERASISRKQYAHSRLFDIQHVGPTIENIYKQALRTRRPV